MTCTCTEDTAALLRGHINGTAQPCDLHAPPPPEPGEAAPLNSDQLVESIASKLGITIDPTTN